MTDQRLDRNAYPTDRRGEIIEEQRQEIARLEAEIARMRRSLGTAVYYLRSAHRNSHHVLRAYAGDLEERYGPFEREK